MTITIQELVNMDGLDRVPFTAIKLKKLKRNLATQARQRKRKKNKKSKKKKRDREQQALANPSRQ